MIENKEVKERVILVGVCVSDGDDTEVSLKELAELVLDKFLKKSKNAE